MNSKTPRSSSSAEKVPSSLSSNLSDTDTNKQCYSVLNWVKMHASSYAKAYSRPSGLSSASSSGTSTTTANFDRPSTLNLPTSNASTSSTAMASGSTAMASSARPATAGPSSSGASGGIGTRATGGTSTAATNLPSKPSRYTPVYPSLMANTNQAKSSSYTSLTSSSPYTSYTRSQPQAEPQQQVITVPPKSITNPVYETRHQYYQPSQRLQQYKPSGLGSSTTNLAGVSSKSAQNLIESIPDVFCLSCPPVELKFSDAYRAKTLPRTGKEVSFYYYDFCCINVHFRHPRTIINYFINILLE